VEKIRDAIVGDLREEFIEFKAEVRNSGFRIAIETMKRMDSRSRGFPELGQDLTGLVRRIDSLTLDMNRRFEDMGKRIESTMRS